MSDLNCTVCGKPLWLCDSPRREFVRFSWVFYHECCYRKHKPCATITEWCRVPTMDGTVNEVTV